MSDSIRAEEPNFCDARVKENLEGLRRVIRLHQKLDEAGGDPSPWYPGELSNIINAHYVISAWERRDYKAIEQEYVKGWMEYVESVMGEPTHYSLNDFLDNKAIIY